MVDAMGAIAVIAYVGVANYYKEAGPSGQIYSFERGVYQPVIADDADWFLTRDQNFVAAPPAEPPAEPEAQPEVILPAPPAMLTPEPLTEDMEP